MSNSHGAFNLEAANAFLMLADGAEKIVRGEEIEGIDVTAGRNADGTMACEKHAPIIRSLKASDEFATFALECSAKKKAALLEIASHLRATAVAMKELNRLDDEFWARLRVSFNHFTDDNLHYNRATHELEILEDVPEQEDHSV